MFMVVLLKGLGLYWKFDCWVCAFFIICGLL